MKKTIIFLALISSVSHAKDVINLKSLSGTELVGVKMTSLNTGGTTQFLDANKIILKSNIKGNTNSCIGDYQISKVTSAGGHNLVAERGNVLNALERYWLVRVIGILFQSQSTKRTLIF
ncbi:MAG: hypothetical protein ACLGGX_00275 [Bdellovibrionia bacterium]